MSPVEARLLEKVRTERDADSMAIIEVLRAECVAERAKCDALRARVAELEATLAKSLANRITEKAAQAALERQVAAARAECAALETEHLYTRDIECGVSIAAGRVLRAMDEATKK